MSRREEFRTFPFLSGCHSQTILATFFNFHKEPPSFTKFVKLRDGDKLALEVSTPPDWKPTDKTVVMVHGLCGSHGSPYMIRIAKKLFDQGVRAIRLNMRGCGTGRGHSKMFYHSGCSADVLEALELLKEEHPDSPMTLIGFSLGGNISLKLVGELHALAHRLLEKVIAINPPVDLLKCVKRLSQPENRFYERYFLYYLKSDVNYRHRRFPELGKVKFPRKLSLFHFDEFYVAPQCGFTSAIDYYHASSARYVIKDIAIPCHILLAEDDPVIDPKVIDPTQLPDNVKLMVTEKGGHLGYLASPSQEGGVRWLDNLVLDWVNTPHDAP